MICSTRINRDGFAGRWNGVGGWHEGKPTPEGNSCQVLCIIKLRRVSSLVSAPKPVPPDYEYICAHLQAVSKHAHFCRRRVCPTHRYFNGVQPMVSGQIQKFRIEPEPLDGLLFKNNPASLPSKRLESALGVYERQT